MLRNANSRGALVLTLRIQLVIVEDDTGDLIIRAVAGTVKIGANRKCTR